MKLDITRTTFTSQSTIGELKINGQFECFTLEDVVRADGIKIFGETAIPAGQYKVLLTMSPRFKRVLPLLVAVAGYEGVRIHPGNSAKDTEGCILVGTTKSPDWIGNSVVAFNALFTKLSAASAHGETILLDLK